MTKVTLTLVTTVTCQYRHYWQKRYNARMRAKYALATAKSDLASRAIGAHTKQARATYRVQVMFLVILAGDYDVQVRICATPAYSYQRLLTRVLVDLAMR